MSNTSHPTDGTNMDAVEFDREQAHLCSVYNTLAGMGRSLANKIELARKQVAQEKEDMSSEIAPNFATDTDTLETYAEYATANNLIGAYNVAQDANIERLSKLNLLLKQPYFAKISLMFADNGQIKDLYLGTAGATDEDYKRLVVDWRSPIAEVYYNQALGATSYEANGKTIHVDLKQRRQFDIHKNVLESYFDTSVAIQDALLLKSLSQERSAHMQAITSTIQKEQNRVIRYEEVPALLVSGIAGSGKTSVLLQRLAFLFYQNRHRLHSSEVYLVSPNKLFSKYIEHVLPDLGEENPETFTWDEFAKSLLPFGRSLHSCTNDLSEIYAIDKALEGFTFDESDIKDIVIDGVKLISQAQILQLMRKYPNVTPGPHLVTLIREDLYEKLSSKINQLATTEKIQNEVLLLPLDDQVSLFNGPYDPQNEEDAVAMAKIYLHKRFAAAIDAITNDEWLRIDRIGMRLLHVENLTTTSWLYLKCAVTGMSNHEAKYLIIDEVQDYHIDQLAVLLRYFKNAKLLMLGDEFQAIKENTAHFNDIALLCTYLRGSVDTCELMTSYRSTPQITNLFTRLIPSKVHSRIQTIQRDETAPALSAFTNTDDYRAALEKLLCSAHDKEGLTALIVPWKSAYKSLANLLGDSTPPLINTNTHFPESGLVCVTLEQAKGLEFDTVIIPDASEKVFPSGDTLARNRLYTSISRANKRLYIFSNGEMTSFLHGNK